MNRTDLISRPARLTLCAVVATVLLGGCQKNAAPPAPPPPEVDVAAPVVREAIEWDEYTGRLAAVDAVEVRPRVTGFIEQIHFKAGQIVNKGDRLFTIDARPFQAEFDRADADVTRAKGELDRAEFDLERVTKLRTSSVAPEKEYRDVLFAHQKAKADLENAEASKRLAGLNLEWTSVTAPIAGRISREYITEGNLVQSSSTLLTTIVSLDPIHCYFDADEQAYLKYARLSKSGERASSRDHATPIFVSLFDEKSFVHPGHMDFVDNMMDRETGTMRGRAVIPNPDGLLIPGLFVRVRLPGSGLMPMIFVPDVAIATDQTSRLVYTVDKERVVQPRHVKIGRLRNGLRRITSGLDGTETVVVAGIQRVRPGAKVTMKRVEVCTENWKPDEITVPEAPHTPMTQPVEGGE